MWWNNSSIWSFDELMMLRLLIQTPCFAVYNLTKIAKCKRKQISCSHQKSFSHLLKVTPKNRFHLFAPTVSCDSCRVIINLVLFILQIPRDFFYNHTYIYIYKLLANLFEIIQTAMEKSEMSMKKH